MRARREPVRDPKESLVVDSSIEYQRRNLQLRLKRRKGGLIRVE
jgi:hypothetical protein